MEAINAIISIIPAVHICPDEINAALYSLPFVGIGAAWVRGKLRWLRRR
jgi:hypothetical protein